MIARNKEQMRYSNWENVVKEDKANFVKYRVLLMLN